MKKVLILLVWLISLTLIIYSINNTRYFFVNGTMVLGWILLSIQLTMSNYEKFYLWVKRLEFNIINPECVWNMVVSLKGNFSRNSFEIINNTLYKISEELKITKISNTRYMYRMKTINLEVNADEDGGVISISVLDLELSYRRSKNIISKEFAGIFEELRNNLKPDSGEYGLNIEFKNYNPYFGFFVRRLNAKEVEGFNATFKIDDDRVAVSKTSLKIYTTNLNHLSNLSREYLGLSPARL